MKLLKYFSILILFMLFLASCTEKININLDDSYTRLVVDGAITSDTAVHKVILSTTTSFYYNQAAPGVTGALVTINDGFQTITLHESIESPGTYLTDSNTFGIEGRIYSLQIDLPAPINGFSQYKASCELKPVAKLDSIGLHYLDTWEFWEIQCYALDPPAKNFYLFKNYVNGKLVSDTISELIVTDDRMFNGNYTNGVAAGYLSMKKEDEAIKSGDTVKLQISGITEEYARFIWSVQTESGYKNPLFSGPPANVKGNISNGAVGFFTAYSANYATVVAKY